MEQSWDKVASTLFQRRTPTLYQRCAMLKIRRRLLFHFQRRINVISTLIHNVETTLIRRWNVGWVRKILQLDINFVLFTYYLFFKLFWIFCYDLETKGCWFIYLIHRNCYGKQPSNFLFFTETLFQIFQLPLLWKMNLVNKYFLKILLLYLQIYQM